MTQPIPTPPPLAIFIGLLHKRQENLAKEDLAVPIRLQTANDMLGSVSYILVRNKNQPDAASLQEASLALKAISDFTKQCYGALQLHEARIRAVKRQMTHDGYSKHERKAFARKIDQERPAIKSRELRRLVFGLVHFENKLRHIQASAPQ